MTRRFFIISKPLIVLLFLFIAAGNLYSQNITWFKVYDWRIQGNDAGYAICKADENNFFVVGATGQRILLFKINQNGDTLYTKVIGQTENRQAFSITPDNNNNFYITGEAPRAFVVKININCEVLWEKYFTEQSGVHIYSSKLFSDNSLVSCGRIGTYNGYIQKIDTAGNLIWNKTVDGGFFKEFNGLEEDEAGNVVLTGHDFANGHFSKYSSSGIFIYEKSTETFFSEKLRKINGGYYLGGFNFDVVRTDTGGNIINRKNYKNIKRDEELYDFQMISDNRYIMCGLSFTSLQDTMYGKIIIADTSGVVIHQKLVPNFANLLSFNGIFITQGGDLMFTGFREIKNLTREDVLIMRTNQYLEGPTVGINNNQIFVKDFQLFQNYPNPFNPSTIIKYSIPKAGFVSIKIFDVVGRMVKELVSEVKETGNYSVAFDGSQFASGVYFYGFETGSFSDTKRMVLVK